MRKELKSALLASGLIIAAQSANAATPNDASKEGAATEPNAAACQQQTPAAADDEEIIVTGRLRNEDIQRAPIAVTAITAAAIEDLHSPNVMGLTSLAPNLTISGGGPTGNGVAAISLRGFATTSSDPSVEPGIAVYVDGVYQSLIVSSLADIGDVEGIEVLRGPQGALLGKSTSAGAIMIRRARPTGEYGVDASVEYGSHNLVLARATVNFPIVQDVLAGKIYGSLRRRDDWVENLTYPNGDMGAEDVTILRGALLFTPSNNFEVYLTADYNWTFSNQTGQRSMALPGTTICNTWGSQLAPLCTAAGDPPRTTRSNFVVPPHSYETNVTLQADWSLGGATATSITGWREYYLISNSDFDGAPVNVLHINQTIPLEQFSQEFRLKSESGGPLTFGDHVSWVVGGYYGTSASDETRRQLTGGTPAAPAGLWSSQRQHLDRESLGIFGSADWRVFDQVVLTGGVRRNWDTVDHAYGLAIRIADPVKDPGVTQFESAEFDNTSVEAGVRYEIDPDRMLYFRYAQGYRGGGFVGIPASVATAASYRPETSENYEVGFRSNWSDDRVILNLTAFNTNYEDLQRRVSTFTPTGTNIQIILNAAAARVRGVELESTLRPFGGLRLDATVGYLDSKYLRYVSVTTAGPQDLSNRPLTYAPKWTGRLAASYSTSLGDNGFLGFDQIEYSADWNYRSTYFQLDTLDPLFAQPGYGTVGATVTLSRGSHLELSGYVRNAFDEEFALYRSGAGNAPYIMDDIGQTVGVVLRVSR